MVGKTNKLKISIGTAANDSSFVGLSLRDDTLFVEFPMGYHLNPIGENEPSNETYNDIRTLIRLLSDCKEEGILPLEESDMHAFPIYEYMFVIEYFIRNDFVFYKETEVAYDVRDSGKISWNKTIKNTTPSITKNGVVFLNTIRRYNSPKDNDLITKINKYCVYRALLLLGPLYGNLMVDEPSDQPGDNIELWISFLNQKINHTNDDTRKKLFTSMIYILQNQGTGDNRSHYTFGTRSFHNVWERMVDIVFGSSDVIKDKFYPSITWKLLLPEYNKEEPSSKLRPDTICINENKDVFIIDAKYYQFGIRDNMRNLDLLPKSSDVNKQFTYAAYAKQKFSNEYTGKYLSVFMIPYDGEKMLMKVAEAMCEWYNDDELNLYAYVVDTKKLVLAYLNSKHLQYNF